MRHCLLLIGVVAAAVGLPVADAQDAAPAVDKSGAQQGEVVVSKLSLPVYPPLAQQAHISGDVELTIRVRPDGSIEFARLLSGHPVLVPAALESAKKSLFECHGCGDAITYSLTYKYQIVPRDPPKNCLTEPDPPAPPTEVDLTRHQVAVFAWELWTCDGTSAITTVRSRSAKCLYLWRCKVSETVLY
jgi:hypothetical protein